MMSCMPPPNLRHNVVALGADYGLFLVAMSFASPSTILPAFAAWLGAPNVVIGAIPAALTLGWFLPPLFTAAHTESLARKLPFVLRYTIWERVPFAVLAAAAFWLAPAWPGLTLALVLVMLVVITGVGGALTPAWMDIVGRAVPVTIRGRFFSLTAVAAAATGLAGTALTTEIFARIPAPASYALCFVCATVCMIGSFVALALVREPIGDAVPAARAGMRAYLRRVPGLLRGDPNLRWFLVVRWFSLVAGTASAFYAVYALRAWGAPPATLGIFTALLLAGSMAGLLALGWVADHAGYRVVIMTGIVAALAANVVALVAPSLSAFGAVFVLAGVQEAAFRISYPTVLLEFAPAPEAQPMYIGVGNTSLTPIAFAAPIGAGLLADRAGFGAVFATASVAGVLALATLALRVRDPRHAAVLATGSGA
jgi:MFS family permease